MIEVYRVFGGSIEESSERGWLSMSFSALCNKFCYSLISLWFYYLTMCLSVSGSEQGSPVRSSNSSAISLKLSQWSWIDASMKNWETVTHRVYMSCHTNTIVGSECTAHWTRSSRWEFDLFFISSKLMVLISNPKPQNLTLGCYCSQSHLEDIIDGEIWVGEETEMQLQKASFAYSAPQNANIEMYRKRTWVTWVHLLRVPPLTSTWHAGHSVIPLPFADRKRSTAEIR